MSDKEKTPPVKKNKPAAPKHKLNSKTRSTKVSPLVTQDLDELISNLELLKPVKKDWKYRIGEFIGQLILTAVALILLGCYIWSITVVPPNTKLFGYEIGSKLSPNVYEQINIAVKDKVNDPINFQTPQGTFTVTPQQIGLELDLPATVNGIRKNVFTFLKSSIFSSEIKPTISLDENSFKIALAKVITANTKDPINATLATQGGKVVTTEAVSGTQIDWEKTKKSLRESWLYEGRKAEVVIAYIPPAVSNEDVNKVRSNLADLAVASPITLKIGTRSIEISPEVIGTALNFVPNKEKLESKFDETVIVNEISRQIPNIQTTASDAKFDFIGDKVVVVPAQEGIKFNPGQLDAALSPVFRQKDNRVVNLDSAVIKPLISTESLDALGIKEQLSTFRQDFDYLPYRETNVGQAARYMDGKILKPGEIYSMNETIKERTTKNGYVKGIYIGEGGRFDFGLGGGVSIITSATWTAAFYAGLERIEQRAHSVHIARYTPGLEATVSWPKLDLKFRNNTKNNILIKAIPARDGITISMYGTIEYDRITAKFGEPYNLNNNIDTVNSYDPNCLAQDPAPGFKIVVTRQFWKNNSIVQSENLTTSYKPSDHVICLKEGEVAPSASPSVVPAASGVPQPAPQS
ncbi:MAG: VanW family protein [Actinobacteria bacterium]|nr:VanW family protein [Actinomycetota bacterium]